MGIGNGVNVKELNRIVGDPKNVYTAADFQTLISDAFINKLKNKACNTGMNLIIILLSFCFLKIRTITPPVANGQKLYFRNHIIFGKEISNSSKVFLGAKIRK